MHSPWTLARTRGQCERCPVVLRSDVGRRVLGSSLKRHSFVGRGHELVLVVEVVPRPGRAFTVLALAPVIIRLVVQRGQRLHAARARHRVKTPIFDFVSRN